MDRFSAAQDSINTCFYLKQSIHKATEFASKLLAQLSAILFGLLAYKRAYVNHVMLLNHVACYLWALPLRLHIAV